MFSTMNLRKSVLYFGVGFSSGVAVSRYFRSRGNSAIDETVMGEPLLVIEVTKQDPVEKQPTQKKPKEANVQKNRKRHASKAKAQPVTTNPPLEEFLEDETPLAADISAGTVLLSKEDILEYDLGFEKVTLTWDHESSSLRDKEGDPYETEGEIDLFVAANIGDIISTETETLYIRDMDNEQDLFVTVPPLPKSDPDDSVYSEPRRVRRRKPGRHED